MENKDEQEDIAEFYDEEAEEYDNRFSSYSGKYIHQRQTSILLDQLGDIEGSRILEIAAGTGRFTQELVAHGADVVVVDISREMLKQNRERTGEATFIHGSGTHLPFSEASFDHCITVNSLNHIPGHWDVVREVHRVLKSSGGFIANYPNKWSNRLPIALYVNYHNRNVGGGVYTKWFDIFEVKNRLAENGFEIRACTGDRLSPVKAASKITVPLAKRMEQLLTSTPLSNFCVSPFVTAVKS
jgi:ubiquinone/menaquinone biosynthesis C-methylase UbiE